MNIKIEKSRLQGEIDIISSKSHIHRLMIGAALADSPTVIEAKGWSLDMEATKNCLEAMGGRIEHNEDEITVTPIGGGLINDCMLNCGESGSTLRFLLPVAAALGGGAAVTGEGRLPQRPIDVLTEELARHGCKASDHKLPLVIEGKIKGGRYVLPGNISSQFITGLLFALPLLEEDSEICLTTELESAGYVNMTLEVLSAFGIKTEISENGYKIKGGQAYSSPKRIRAEGDWSSAAFWIGAGAVLGDITCKGMNKASCQSDKAVADIISRFGGRISWDEKGIRSSAGELKGIEIDASQIPDLVPILSAVAAVARGNTFIYNAGRLRIKESDRLRAMTEGLKRLGVNVEEKPDGLIIEGGCQLPEQQTVLDSYGDHRIVMSLTIAAAALGADAVIEGAEAVKKSYPSFFADFIRIGGIADVI